MKRSLVFLALALGLLAAIFVTADPLGLLAPPAERAEDDAPPDAREIEEPARLAGREGAVAPRSETWLDGDRIGSLDLGLGGAALTGTVLGGGEPLPAARVRVVLADTDGGGAVRTRDDGTWEIRGVPAGAHVVRFTATAYRGRTIDAPTLGEASEADLGEVDLERTRASTDGIRVRVTDQFGRPIPGAKVMATTMMWGLHLAMGPEMSGTPGVLDKQARTNDQGEAALLGLPPEAYDVVAIAEGYQVASQARVIVAHGQVKRIVLRLLPGASISGHVVDAEGNPLANAYVTGLHQPSWANALTVATDADGSFTLPGLREGSYMIVAGHLEQGEVMANPVKSPSTGVRLQLSGAGTIDVTVVRPDGTPVPRYRLRPYRAEPFGYTYSMTVTVDDEAGHTTVTMPPGAYTLSVKADGGDHDATQGAAVQVGETTTVKLVLPESASVTGVVTDADGNHVGGAEIYVRRGGFPTEPVREQYARTDGDGAFRLGGLPRESVRLHVRHAQYAPAVVEVDLSGGASEELTVRLGEGAAVEGRVLRAGEVPVVGETVSMFLGFNFMEASSTVTDDNGHYRIDGLGAGTYTVATGAMENQGGGVRRSGVVVPETGVVTVDFDLGAADASGVIGGVVTMGGQPLADATVSVIDDRGFEFAVAVKTDAEGRFRAEGVRAGSVTLYVQTAGGVSRTEGGTVPEEGEGGPVAIDFGSGTIRGRLVKAGGAPVSGAWITVETAGDETESRFGRVRAQTTSDQVGGFTAGGLDPGAYRVRVAGSGHAAMLTDPFVVPASGTLDLGTFELASGTTIQGRVVDDAGTPIEDATISLADGTGRPVFTFSLVTTGSDGRYAVTGIEPGNYTIGFERRGYAPTSRTVQVGPAGATADGVLLRGGAIEVAVETVDGQPQPGLRVSLLDSSGRLVERTLSLVSLFEGGAGLTDPEGRARIPDLAQGTYTVTVRQDGWETVGDPPTVRVSAGRTEAVPLVIRWTKDD